METNHSKEMHSMDFTNHVKDIFSANIEKTDINVRVGSVTIIVYNNSRNIYIEGEKTKILFEIPTNHAHSSSEHIHTQTTVKEKEDAHEEVEKSAAETPSHDTHQHESEIDLSCEGVKILLCNCCTELKITGQENNLTFPLEQFKDANRVLTIENGVYVRRYNVELHKHTTNETDQKLIINGNNIEFEYNPALRAFTTHLFFRQYSSILDLLVDYLKANPDLKEFKHH
jgi:hypothetical protein